MYVYKLWKFSTNVGAIFHYLLKLRFFTKRLPLRLIRGDLFHDLFHDFDLFQILSGIFELEIKPLSVRCDAGESSFM